MAAIKHEKLLGIAVMQRMRDAAAQILASPRRAEPLAFNAKKRNFVERIDHSQACVEFQAVDDTHRIPQTNVLRTQVSVAIDDMPRSNAFGEKAGALHQKPALHRNDAPYASRWQVKARVEQNTAIEGNAAPQLCGIFRRRDEHDIGAAIELHKHSRQPIELPAVQVRLPNHTVQHLRVVEAVHRNQPIDDFAIAAKDELVRRPHQRNDVLVDIRRKAPVELELGPASRLPSSQR